MFLRQYAQLNISVFQINQTTFSFSIATREMASPILQSEEEQI